MKKTTFLLFFPLALSAYVDPTGMQLVLDYSGTPTYYELQYSFYDESSFQYVYYLADENGNSDPDGTYISWDGGDNLGLFSSYYDGYVDLMFDFGENGSATTQMNYYDWGYNYVGSNEISFAVDPANNPDINPLFSASFVEGSFAGGFGQEDLNGANGGDGSDDGEGSEDTEGTGEGSEGGSADNYSLGGLTVEERFGSIFGTMKGSINDALKAAITIGIVVLGWGYVARLMKKGKR